jgi:hypothetical protein
VIRTIAALAMTLAAATGCAKAGAPEQVADAFAEAYFLEMDQGKAKEYTALGASAMLDAEIRDVEKVRREGYGPAEAGAKIRLHRGEASHRDERLRFPFEITIQSDDDTEMVRVADVELAQIDGAWKVVRLGLDTR